jgi:hypothetical protein
MNIIRIRCREALPAFRGADVFTADDKTQIRMIPCGHFIVTVNGVSQLVPHSAVRVADVEFPTRQQHDEYVLTQERFEAEIGPERAAKLKKKPVPAIE